MGGEWASIIIQQVATDSAPHTLIMKEKILHIFTGGFTYLPLEMCYSSSKREDGRLENLDL